MSKNDPVLVKQIREIVKSEYEYWATYNDPLKAGRKIKFCRNGYRLFSAEKNAIKTSVEKKLKKAGITVKQADWEVCQSYRGAYDAFIVRI